MFMYFLNKRQENTRLIRISNQFLSIINVLNSHQISSIRGSRKGHKKNTLDRNYIFTLIILLIKLPSINVSNHVYEHTIERVITRTQIAMKNYLKSAPFKY